MRLKASAKRAEAFERRATSLNNWRDLKWCHPDDPVALVQEC